MTQLRDYLPKHKKMIKYLAFTIEFCFLLIFVKKNGFFNYLETKLERKKFV